MLLRDRLLARMSGHQGPPDYVALAAEVLGIRNAPPALARRLVDQALVVEDRREAWLRAGQRLCEAAPPRPGVYRLVRDDGRVVYVGKANDIRRRLQAHFAARRWRAIGPGFARIVDGTWQVVGSEVEALVCEAEWIRRFEPLANVQVASPVLETRAIPRALVRDVMLVLPTADEGRVLLLGARVGGDLVRVEVGRDGAGAQRAATRLRAFFAGTGAGEEALRGLAPIVFSWLAGRGAATSRLDPHDAGSARELGRRLVVLLGDAGLFGERIVVLRSGVRSTTSTRP